MNGVLPEESNDERREKAEKDAQIDRAMLCGERRGRESGDTLLGGPGSLVAWPVTVPSREKKALTGRREPAVD
jgi:hypothetical protein